MFLQLLVATVLALGSTALAPTVTLEAVPVTALVGPWDQIGATATSVSRAGVGADGLTTYVEYGYDSGVLDVSGTVVLGTFALNSDEPFTATFREDASHFEEGTASVGGLDFESCVFEANTEGVCVYDIFPASFPPTAKATLTETFSGLVVPFYTLDAAVNTGGSSLMSATSSSTSPASSATTVSTSAHHPKSHTGAVAGGIVVGAVVLLCSGGLLFWIRHLRRKSSRASTSPFTSPAPTLPTSSRRATAAEKRRQPEPGPSTSTSRSPPGPAADEVAPIAEHARDDRPDSEPAHVQVHAPPGPPLAAAAALPNDELVRILYSRLQSQNTGMAFYGNVDEPPPGYPGSDAGTD
ncbi:hypothetical protein MIND_00277400 [Mycena indigotica]|uniref:Uncharacterized protein n=1 Tax=Mycena indigotica TaxID=2126181 RepID=A0A8H6WF86_9AGAR|nr:uncharacterized protein MIND_00277400 [Mycena indigotica]KAF7312633.1 hypothetical protein MIND_00277400 [Mycena indigotica]